jgi:hypothetical protein
MNRISLPLYILLGILGFGLLAVTVRVNITVSSHIGAVAGILAVWFSGWGIGRNLKSKKQLKVTKGV